MLNRIRVEWAYQRQAESEISVEKGEVAVLVDASNPEWWEIIKADGSAGFVPANFVNRLEGDTPPTVEDGNRDSVVSLDLPSLSVGEDNADPSANTLNTTAELKRRSTSSKGVAPRPAVRSVTKQLSSTVNSPHPSAKPDKPVWKRLSKCKSTDSEGEDEEPAEGGQEQLPRFWSKKTDNLGQAYYFNTKTQESQWTHPRLLEPLAVGWVAQNDDEGNVYYFHVATQRSVWTRPTGMDDAFTSGSGMEVEGDAGRIRSGSNSGRTLPDVPASTKSMLYESNVQRKVVLERGKKGKKSWDSHFAQLKETSLLLYKDEKAVRQKKMGSIKPQISYSLEHALVGIVWDPRKRPIFEIKTRDDNHLYIQCDSDSSVSCWVRAITINQQATGAEPLQNEYDRPPFMTADEASKQTCKKGEKKKVDRKAQQDAEVGRRREKKDKRLRKSSSLYSRLSQTFDDIDESGITREEKTTLIKRRIFKFLQSRPNKDEVDGIVQEPYFGGSLSLACLLEFEADRPDVACVPRLVVLAIEQIDKRGMDIEGIYRLSGTLTMIQKIRTLADAGEKLDFSTVDDINTITGALKLYFRELSDPCIPFHLYDKFIATMRTTDHNDRLYEIKELTACLPKENFDTLSYLFEHLKRVAGHCGVNKMTPTNLAIVFGPTLMKPEVESVSSIMHIGYQQNLIELMIEHHEWIFGEN